MSSHNLWTLLFLMLFRIVYALVLSVSAAPSPVFSSGNLQKRSEETCGGFNGLGGFFDTSFNFTLSTLNNTEPSGDGTQGTPLALDPIGKRHDVESEVLSARTCFSPSLFICLFGIHLDFIF